MTDNSPYTKFKSKLKQENPNKAVLKQPVTKLSNAVCIQNLVKNSSLFAPSRLEPMYIDKPLKAIYNLKQLKYKKQIQPHQARKSGCFVGKSMSSLMSDKKVEQKHDRHQRNASAIWQNNKKLSKDGITQQSYNQAPTASFYLKKGDIPLFYQLKMNIKKVESCVKPNEGADKKILRSRYRSKNLPISYQKIESDLPSISNKDCIQTKQSIQIIKQTEITEVKIEQSKFSIPIKSQNQKQRYIKSTLIQYASKSNLKRNKEPIQLASQLQHIKNLLKLSNDQLNEQYIQLIDSRIIAINNLSERAIPQDLMLKISANCLSVCHFDRHTQILTSIYSRQPNRRVQIASLTKIMTCYLVLNIAATFNLDIMTQKMLVSEKASKMIGTSAGLGYSDTLTIYELLHALMLPSGNDAAVALAEWGGKTIRKYVGIAQKYSTNTIESKTVNFVNDLIIEKKTYQKLFVWHMNRAAVSLKLRNTRFMNPHGLMNQKASSSANDLTILTCLAMQHQIFAEIVNKREFSCKVFNRTYSQTRNVEWKNTNKLLNNQGFIGVKTGVTPSAGPCLASMFQINERECITVVVLRTRSMESRFKQSSELVKQVLNVLGVEIVNPSANKLTQDDQQTDISQENDKGEEANLVLDQKQSNSDQDMQEDEEDQE